jgi:lysophospholipase L1-like esterase
MFRKTIGILKVVLTLITFRPAEAQDTTVLTKSQAYDFIDEEENRIHNGVQLSHFYERLFNLKKGQDLQVNIIHLGDSHIQADYLSRTVRRRIQTDFGNAGRGLVIPWRVAKTNEPANMVSSSSSAWEVKRCVFPDQPLPIGIGGITIKTLQPQASFTIRTIDGPSLDYRFNKITLFFQKDFSSFNMEVKDSVNENVAFIGPYTFEAYPNISTVLLPFRAHQVSFNMLSSTTAQTQATIFGINLEINEPGVLYHAIGVNGAKFKHYLAASLFAEQTRVLNPDLFIISMGTNEALDYPYADPELVNQIDSLIGRLRLSNPNAQFLLTVPTDSFRRKTRRNPGIEIVRTKIVSYADQRNIPYWDLYTVGGGKHSADFWRKNRLMQSDGIHFTVAGYELQGNLLYDALMKGYHEYVEYRHP